MEAFSVWLALLLVGKRERERTLSLTPRGFLCNPPVIGEWLAHQRHSSEVEGSNLGSGFPVWSLYAPPVLAVFSEHFSLLPHSKIFFLLRLKED